MPKRSLDTASMAEGSAPNSRQPNSLFVSFSKRRKGLFNKASELCKYCGAEVAVLVLSPTGNPFAFGHSSVDAVLHRYYLRQITPPNSTNYPLMITGAGITGRVGAFSDEHRNQAQQLKTLKARVKQAQSGEGSALRELKASIEKAWESCKTVEELEFLKQKYLALLDNVRSRLLIRRSSSFSGEEKVVGTSTDLVGPVHFTEEYLISCTSGFDGKVVHKNPMVGPVDDCDGNNTSIQPVRMAAEGVFQHPVGGDSSDEEHVIYCDVHPLSQNDMSYSLENYGHSSQEGKVLVEKACNYGGDTTTYTSSTLVELLENYLNQYRVNGEFDDRGNSGIGMEGNNNSKFSPPLGDNSAANVFGNVRPLAVVGPSNALSNNSIENFGYLDCAGAGSGYGETVGVSDDEVFNYLGQVPSFYLDDLASSF